MLSQVTPRGTDISVLENPSSLKFSLSVIVPTRNESGNIETLLLKINQALDGINSEVLFVDDSDDETPQEVEAVAPSLPNLHIRLLHRDPAQRVGGLGGAVLLGLKNSNSNYACIMDGDLQHPPEMLPLMWNIAQKDKVDLVVATRRNGSSQVTGLSEARNTISHGLDLMSRMLFPRRLNGVSDPLSGFFMLRVKAIDLAALRPEGFKILLEILVRNPNLRKAEVPFHFGERHAGKSKASTAEALKYMKLLWGLRFGNGSLRLAGFAMVGASGILINSLALYLASSMLNIHYLFSVALATVASTVWNFTLTELLVYRSKQSAGRLRRFALFSVMNIAALALRSPVIYVMTSLLSINLVISNLFTLVLLTGIRFLTADSMIWGKTPIYAPAYDLNAKPSYAKTRRTFSYNIHNLVSVVSEGELPELEPFQVLQEIKEPTIRVRIGIPPAVKRDAAKDNNYMRFREIFGHAGFEVGIWMGDQVNVVASPLLRLSPHVLYTNVIEPILRWTFVKNGYALVHGATIAFGDEAFIITARTDTGKTTTLLKILSHQRRDTDRAGFLSDDMTIISPDGIAHTYPKPLTISAHTLSAINADTLSFKERMFLPLQSRIHSRTGRKVATLITKSLLPAATINMILQILVPPPKYFVKKLIPRVKLTPDARYVGMFIIERGGDGTKTIDNEEAIKILLSNCEDAYGFPPYDNIKEFLYYHNGVDLRQVEQGIIRQAFSGLPATLLQSKKLDWWCLIPSFIDEKMASDCQCEINPTRVEALQTVTGD